MLFRSGLGETQEGGGAVSECFQAASRMTPGDAESWHAEWIRVADRNDRRGDEAERAGHIRTAMNCWQRAADYFRQAEFWLAADDPRVADSLNNLANILRRARKLPEADLRKAFYEDCGVDDNDSRRMAYFRARKWAIGKGMFEVVELPQLDLTTADFKRRAN